MNYKYIIYEKEGNIARLTFNKPEKMNTYTFIGRGEDAAEIYDALDDAAEDDDIKVVILKGAGRAFSAGHDLTKVGFIYGFGTKSEDRRPSQRIRLSMDKVGFADDFKKLFLHPKITIAQIHGYCVGGGLLFVQFCDMAIAAEDAQIGHTEQRLGFAGSGVPNITHLIMTIGLKRALDLLLTGRLVDGKEAETIGLVNRAVPADKLGEETDKLAKALALLPRDGIAIGKATRHLIYERLGLIDSFTHGYITHTMFTNLRWEPDEYNFFKERRDKGAKTGFHGRDERYAGLV